jgi:hypothetical protein
MVLLAWSGLLLVGGCGGGEDSASESNASSDTGATSDADRRGEPVVIRTGITVAPTKHAEPIATGEVLEGSTVGGSPFCVGGEILDSHMNDDDVEKYCLIDRTITCPDGTVRVGFTPGEPGSWTIVSGTGAFEELRGSGEMETSYDPDDEALAGETLTGTVTR